MEDNITLDLSGYNTTQLNTLRKALEQIGSDESILTIIDDLVARLEVKNEKKIPITLHTILNTCGWTEYCDVTGGNHYMLREWSVSESEVFWVRESHAKELRLIR